MIKRWFALENICEKKFVQMEYVIEVLTQMMERFYYG